MLAVASLVIPAVIVFGALGGWIGAVLVPEGYRSSFTAGGTYVVAAIGILSIRQYSLDPVFLLFGTAARAMGGPAMTIALLVLLASVPIGFGSVPLQKVNVSLIVSSLAGLGVTLSLLVPMRGIAWPIMDLLRLSAVATAMTLVAMLLPPALDPALAVGKLVALVLVFVSGMLALNVLGLRVALRKLLGDGRA